VQVLANKEAIHQLEKDYPALDDVLKALLRNYPGIYHFETQINEFEIARYLENSWDYVEHILHQLDKLQYIAYHEKSNQPQLVFLHDRIPETLLQFNTKLLYELKKRHESRVLFMISLCQNHTRCRSKYLINYFDEILDHDCGLCDLCVLKNKKSQVEKFEQHKTVILQTIKKQGSCLIDTLLANLKHDDKEALLQTVRILLDEQILQLDKNGRLIRYEEN
jgi:ATP-dependent DNA helicase RecQ